MGGAVVWEFGEFAPLEGLMVRVIRAMLRLLKQPLMM
jgi:hypothetical protein